MKSRRLLVRQVANQEGETSDAIAQIMCDALGVSGKEASEDSKLLKEIAIRSLAGQGVTSKDLSRQLGMPRSTILYKLNYLIENNLVARHGRQYFLRGMSLEQTIEQLEAEMRLEFERLLKLASKFDELAESEIYGKRRRKGQ